MVGMEERLEMRARAHQPGTRRHEQVPVGLSPGPIIANPEFIAFVGFKDNAHRQLPLPVTRPPPAPPARADYDQALGWWEVLRRFSPSSLSHGIPSSKKPRNGGDLTFFFLFSHRLRRSPTLRIFSTRS